MIKEQTPIEQLIKKANVVGTADADVLEYLNRNKDWFIEIERYHILKILEREFKDITLFTGIGMARNGKEYYKTEIKPKYQNKDE